RGGEAVRDGMLEEVDERRPISRDVGDDHRLAVQAELPPGQHLDGLVERAEAAGQYRESVGQLEHALLALMHAGDDDQVLNAAMRHFAVVEMTRHDAGDAAAGGERGVGERAHEPDAAAAIDELDAGLREQRAETRRRLAVAGVDARRRAAIDAQALDHRHFLDPRPPRSHAFRRTAGARRMPLAPPSAKRRSSFRRPRGKAAQLGRADRDRMGRGWIIGLAAVVVIAAAGVTAWEWRSRNAAVPGPGTPPRAQTTPAPTPTAPSGAPSFDVVRVNPQGEAVIAGRAAPGSEVHVLDGDREIGRVTADRNGEWVLVP